MHAPKSNLSAIFKLISNQTFKRYFTFTKQHVHQQQLQVPVRCFNPHQGVNGCHTVRLTAGAGPVHLVEVPRRLCVVRRVIDPPSARVGVQLQLLYGRQADQLHGQTWNDKLNSLLTIAGGTPRVRWEG